jgi:hypothetical protein
VQSTIVAGAPLMCATGAMASIAFTVSVSALHPPEAPTYTGRPTSKQLWCAPAACRLK